MGNFLVWDISTKADGVWRNVVAADAKAAAEAICGQNLRSVGEEHDLCARVRSMDDPSKPATTFYGKKSGQAAREYRKQQELRKEQEQRAQQARQLQAAE